MEGAATATCLAGGREVSAWGIIIIILTCSCNHAAVCSVVGVHIQAAQKKSRRLKLSNLRSKNLMYVVFCKVSITMSAQNRAL